MAKPGYVYIMTNRRHGTLYIGSTSNLVRRVWEHRRAEVPGFTRRYGLKDLVYFEAFDDLAFALEREKAMKEWQRAWKVDLIEKQNPDWQDLYEGIAPP